MATLDTITLYNPTKEDFVWNFNNEPYNLGAQQTKSFVEPVGLHIAKHLACKIVVDSFSNEEKTKQPTLVSQSLNYDNPKLRIALYTILKNKELVQKVINAYPFKGLVGEMKEYDQYIARATISPSRSV